MEPKPPGTLCATMGLLRDCFTFLVCLGAYASSLNYNNVISLCDFRTEDYNILKTKNTYQRQFAHMLSS